MKWQYLLIILCLAEGRVSAAASQAFAITLAAAEQKALVTSVDQAAAEAQANEARELRGAAAALQKPKLTLEGSYRYVAEIPAVAIGPTSMEFGQHNNYSLGPQLAYEVYDGGASHKAELSAGSLLKAREEQKQAVRLKILLNVRLAYARVQLGIEDQLNIAEALKLVKVRLKDLKARQSAGAASRLDLLGMQREELDLQLKWEQAGSALAVDLEHLLRLMDDHSLPEPLVPLAANLAGSDFGATTRPANVLLTCDPVDSLIARLNHGRYENWNRLHPQVKSLESMAEAADLEAQSQRSKRYPSFQLFAKASYEYPNGPLDESVWQKMVGLNMTVNLYDGGLIRSRSGQKAAEALATRLQKTGVEQELDENWRGAKNQLAALLAQVGIAQTGVARAKQEAELIYENYRIGTRNYLEAQRAETQVLDAQFSLARLKTQIVSQLATLDYLAAGSGNHE